MPFRLRVPSYMSVSGIGSLVTAVTRVSRLHGDDVYNRSVNTQILRLRRKLESDPAKRRYICTESGAGYVFNARVDIIY
jgi:DNA-binding response OmpR family regulator